jgi:hypothetical protein
MSIRNDDKRWLISEAAWAMLEITDEQLERFCDRVEAAVKRDDEPRWLAREFEFKAITNNEI